MLFRVTPFGGLELSAIEKVRSIATTSRAAEWHVMSCEGSQQSGGKRPTQEPIVQSYLKVL
jgi:hypothetical protein